MTRPTHIPSAIAALALTFAIPSPAFSHSDDAPADPTARAPHDLLRGPTVKDDHVPGAAASFAGRPMQGAAARRDERPVRMRTFVECVRRLDAPGVDPALILTGAQRAIVEVAQRRHRDAVSAWRAENREELRTLRRARPSAAPSAAPKPTAAKAPRPGEPIDRRINRAPRAQRIDARPPEERDANIRDKLRDLLRTRPSPEPEQALIWESLTTEQRAFVENRINRARADYLARQRAAAMTRTKSSQDAPDAPSSAKTRQRGQ